MTRCGEIDAPLSIFSKPLEILVIFTLDTQSMRQNTIYSGIIILTERLSLLSGNEVHAPSLYSYMNKFCTFGL